MQRLWTVVAGVIGLALVAAACAPGPAAPAVAPEGPPRSGGELTFIISAEPPSFDGHKETTFALLHPVAPHYSTLLRFDPQDYPKIIPDVAAKMPAVSADKLTYTVELRTDVKFHDGSLMTSKDVLATYQRIIFPPQGVVSVRKGSYAAVEKIEAPDAKTVVFKLKFPSASFLANLASPWNFIYKADDLAKDAKFPEKNINGSGPFKFVEHVKGSHWVGKRNEDYFVKGRPYLDGFRAIFITDVAAQEAAIRGGRALIEFRGFTPSARDNLKRALGDEIAVQESPWICSLYVAVNNKKKPFDDVRVRRALSLAIDRWGGSEALSKIAILKGVGGLGRPGSEFAMSEADLTKVAGYSRDAKASKDKAKQLLKEAGQESLAFKFLNRNIQMPYEALSVFLLDQWKQVGLTVTQDVKETTPYFADLRAGNYEVGIDFNCDFMDEPDLQLAKFLSASKLGKGLNLSQYDDARLDDLYDRQARETDQQKRKQLVWEFERYALDEKAYQFPTIWWNRIVPYSAKVKGWKITPSHYVNVDLSAVWLGQ